MIGATDGSMTAVVVGHQHQLTVRAAAAESWKLRPTTPPVAVLIARVRVWCVVWL